MIKCVILDDELLAISYLKLLCEQIDNVEVVRAFNNPLLFLKEIKNIECDVCILDIEMSGITGLQVATKIPEKKIIFTTAYKEYAAEAFDLDVVDYIRKPIKRERLIQAFEKLSLSLSILKKDFIEWNSNIGKAVILIDQISYIKTSEIDSRDKDIVLHDNSIITLKNLSLKDLLKKLSPYNFVQINKQEIISIKIIKAFSSNEIITNIIIQGHPLKFSISDVYKNSLKEKFKD